jgi:hypothetical protein
MVQETDLNWNQEVAPSVSAGDSVTLSFRDVSQSLKMNARIALHDLLPLNYYHFTASPLRINAKGSFFSLLC